MRTQLNVSMDAVTIRYLRKIAGAVPISRFIEKLIWNWEVDDKCRQ
jgi:hypothetical protein